MPWGTVRSIFGKFRVFRKIHSFFGLALHFPHYCLETMQFYKRNNSVQQFPTPKISSILLRALKQQVFKIADVSNIEVPESSSFH